MIRDLPPILLLGLLSACDGLTVAEGVLDGDCDDGIDNDFNGAIDCDDVGCLADPACDGAVDPDTDTDTDTDTDDDTDPDTDPDTDDDTDPDTDDDTDPGTGRDPIDPAPHACFEVPTGRCPADTPTLGRAGEHLVQFADLTWRYSSRCDVSYTAPLYVRRPSDLRSVGITVDGGGWLTGLGFVAMDGWAVLDIEEDAAPLAWGSPPFKHRWGVASSVVLPNSPATRPPAGDCLSLVPFANGDARGRDATLYLSSRRESRGSTLDLNFVVVGGTDISTDELSSVLAEVRDSLGGAGITVGDVYRWDISTSWGRVLPGTSGSAVNGLRAVELEGATDQAVNVFFVQDISGGGLYGFAGGVPGPVGVPGTPASGVIISVDTHLAGDFTTLRTDEMGQTIAHEIGHQLGLFHLSEATGRDHDVLSDTPECPSSRDVDGDGRVLPYECAGRGADHVMFWTSDGRTVQDRWSAQQADVLLRSPAVRP